MHDAKNASQRFSLNPFAWCEKCLATFFFKAICMMRKMPRNIFFFKAICMMRKMHRNIFSLKPFAWCEKCLATFFLQSYLHDVSKGEGSRIGRVANFVASQMLFSSVVIMWNSVHNIYSYIISFFVKRVQSLPSFYFAKCHVVGCTIWECYCFQFCPRFPHAEWRHNCENIRFSFNFENTRHPSASYTRKYTNKKRPHP